VGQNQNSVSPPSPEINMMEITTSGLHWAAWTNRQALCESLLGPITSPASRAALLNSVDSRGRTPLHIAVAARATQAIEALCRLGADPNVSDATGRTPLHIVCAQGEHGARMASVLLRAGANPRTPTFSGVRPLHVAAGTEGSAHCVADLLAAGARPSDVDDLGRTALHVAASNPNPAALRVLLPHARSLINRGDCTARTPLYYAVVADSPHTASILLAAGAQHGATALCGCTALHEVRSLSTALLLLSHGASTRASCEDGSTPLHAAVHRLVWTQAEANHSEAGAVVSAMVLAGAEVNARTRFGATPLHECCIGSVANVLISHGAHINAHAEDGTTPLQVREHTHTKTQNTQYVG
jgi:ankyrin repeat protein